MSLNRSLTATILVTNVSSNSITLIDEANVEHKVDIPVGIHPHEVVVTPNGKFALVSNYGDLSGKHPGSTLTAIDIENAKAIETIHLDEGSRPHGIVFTSDSRALVTAQGIQSLLIIDFTDEFREGKITSKVKLPGAGAHMVVVTQDKAYAYVTNMDSGTVCQIDLKNHPIASENIKEVAVGSHAEGLTLSHDESLLLVANRIDNVVAVINTSDFTLNKKINTKRGPTRVELFSDGKSALVIDAVAGKAEVLDLETLEMTHRFNTTNTISYKNGGFLGGFFGFLPVPVNARIKNDGTAYITNLFAGNIAHIDVKKGEILKTFEAAGEPDGIDLSPCNFRF